MVRKKLKSEKFMGEKINFVRDGRKVYAHVEGTGDFGISANARTKKKSFEKIKKKLKNDGMSKLKDNYGF